MIKEKAFNRNLGMHRCNLLKDLLRCGECGGNFSVSGGKTERKYRCYGTLNRCDKPRTCNCGAELTMARLDGLVLNMCINKFVNHDIDVEASERIASAKRMIDERLSVISEYQQKMKDESDRFTSFVRRVIKNAVSDDEANAWIAEERPEYEARISEMADSVKRAQCDIDMYKDKIGAYTKMRRKANLVSRQKQLLEDRNLVSEYVRGFLSRIDIYRASRLWALVVVKFLDGGERWGTIKTCRYKNSEKVVVDSADPSRIEYTGIFVNNDKHLLNYDKGNKMVSINVGHDLHNGGSNVETVPFDDFMLLAKNAGYAGSYTKYQYEKH